MLDSTRFASSRLLKNETFTGTESRHQGASDLEATSCLDSCVAGGPCEQPSFALRASEGKFRRGAAKFGGGERDRTDDLLLAKQALSQLSYTPRLRPSGYGGQAPVSQDGLPTEAAQQRRLVGLVGIEPTTPALSRRCSNRLSYRPEKDRLGTNNR
jgi:hypothetical protein